MKLELKYLAFYLPYGLKVQHFIDENIRTLTTSIHTYTTDKIGFNYLLEHDTYAERFKPILKPFRHDTSVEYPNMSKMLHDLEYLGKNFIDVFGLIDAGLAIDINTLNK